MFTVRPGVHLPPHHTSGEQSGNLCGQSIAVYALLLLTRVFVLCCSSCFRCALEQVTIDNKDADVCVPTV